MDRLVTAILTTLCVSVMGAWVVLLVRGATWLVTG